MLKFRFIQSDIFEFEGLADAARFILPCLRGGEANRPNRTGDTSAYKTTKVDKLLSDS